ncbi:MAG: hypothetical protein K2X82_20830 [Gemmataceae bacterium]|nr:hypothetical protein [Gemmataceae bacterium]
MAGEHEGIRPYLIGPTTYREFYAKWLGDENGLLPGWAEPKLTEGEARIRARMEPGDELWEWHNPGRGPFSQTWGLAIVRGGEIVWSECHMRS